MLIPMIAAPILIVALGIYFFYRAAPTGFHITVRKLSHGVFAGFVTLSIFLIAIWMIIDSVSRRPDMKSIVVQANELISRAGGSGEICDEANRLFKTFRSSDNGKFISATDVAAYPAVASLLRANAYESAHLLLYSPPQPHIYLRVGGHFDGYSIVIVGKGVPGNMDEGAKGTVNIANSCIFIEQ